MCFSQRSFLYHPDKAISFPAKYGLKDIKIERLTSKDGEKLELWSKLASANFPTIIYFHGNAGNLGNRVNIFKAFIKAGFGLVAIDYRGFGHSSGSPSEKGLYIDANRAVKYALETLNIDANNIIIYGSSLGSGVAAEIATQYEFKGLVLEAAFTSVTNRAQEIYPWLYVSALLSDRFDTISKLPKIDEKLLILHGLKDNTIPIHHAKELLQKAHEPKKAIFFKNIHHTDFDYTKIAQELLEYFLQ